VQRGDHVRAAARHREVLEGRGWPDVDLVTADALEPQTLGPALQGIEVAYYLVHSMAAGRDFARRDRIAADNFREAAERAGLRRIVYLGGIQPRAHPSEHLASRRETGERLRAGRVPVTEVRAGIIVGPGSAAFEVIRDLVYHLPVMVTPRWVRSRAQPIALDDLLEYLIRLPDLEAAAGGVFDLGGPEVLSYEQLIRQFAEVIGKRPLIVPVPLLSPRLSAYWLDLITAVPANVGRALVEGLRHDIIADDAPIRALIRMRLHTYKEAVVEALHAEQRSAIPARWTEGAFAFRNYRPDIAYYAKTFRVEGHVDAGTGYVWEQVLMIGGEHGWPYMNWLWQIRGALDGLLGGAGVRRGRRDPLALRVGDTLDYWRVVNVEPRRRLTLSAELRQPGAAVLEFELDSEESGGTRLSLSTHFHPAGAPGIGYWLLMRPLLERVNLGLVHALAARAEAAERAANGGGSGGVYR
jgi:uncharacterized protein YbjT (DUF2867 family)